MKKTDKEIVIEKKENTRKIERTRIPWKNND